MDNTLWEQLKRPSWLPADWYMVSPTIAEVRDIHGAAVATQEYMSTYAVVWRDSTGAWRARRNGTGTRVLGAEEQRRFETAETAVVYAALLFQ